MDEQPYHSAELDEIIQGFKELAEAPGGLQGLLTDAIDNHPEDYAEFTLTLYDSFIPLYKDSLKTAGQEALFADYEGALRDLRNQQRGLTTERLMPLVRRIEDAHYSLLQSMLPPPDSAQEPPQQG